MVEGGTRRDRSRDARRTSIVAVARAAFLQNGYAATSMSTIASALGGSKGTLWAYFPSKEDLFVAVVDDVTDNFRQHVDDAFRPGQDCSATLRDFFERLLRKLLDPESVRLHRLIVGEGERFPEIGKIFYARGPQVVLKRLSAYIGACMEDGSLRMDDSVEAATYLLRLAQSHHQLHLWGVTTAPDDTTIREYSLKAVEMFNRTYARGEQ